MIDVCYYLLMRRISWMRAIYAFCWSYFTLTSNGLWGARAYDALAGYFLLAFQIFTLLTLSYFWYFIFGLLKDSRKRIWIIASGLIFIAAWLFLLPGSIALDPSYDLLDMSYDFYVVYGMVLAQVYRINWFWMDWGVWLQCITVYVFGLYLFLIGHILDTFVKDSVKKESKNK